MPAILITHIKQLVNVRAQTPVLRGQQLAELPCIEDAYLLIEDDTIAGYGSMSELPSVAPQMESVNASGRFVLPAWCDSHTHLVFAASRESEFIDKIKGLSYAEIAARVFATGCRSSCSPTNTALSHPAEPSPRRRQPAWAVTRRGVDPRTAATA